MAAFAYVLKSGNNGGDFADSYYEKVIVVGGGIVGLSCAWRLAQRGVAVTVLDSGRLAGESSWAGAGMLAPGGEFFVPTPTSQMAVASLRLYADFVAELAAETHRTIDYRACGAVTCALNEDETAAMENRAAQQAEMGIPSERSSFEGRSARFYPDDALVNPRDVTSALIAACRRRDVRIHEGESVVSVERNGHGVRTIRGTHGDDGVLIAAGAWSSELYPQLRRSYPVKGHLIGWRSEDASPMPIVRDGHTYVLRRSDGSMVAGSSSQTVGFDRAIDPAIVKDIEARAGQLIPSLRLKNPDAWVGFRPGIDGGEPFVGRIGKTGVFAAYGHYRNGILLAPETARRIAELIASS